MIRERPRARALRLLRTKLVVSTAAGQALAPERELAEDCDVSRTTIRWALAKLAKEGRLGPVIGRTRLIADPATQVTFATNAIYLFSCAVDLDGQHSDGWAGHVHLGVQQVLRGLGRSVFIPAGTIDAQMIPVLQRERPSGVVLLESLHSGFASQALVQAAAALATAGIPTVSFGESDLACDRVCSDHAGGAQALTAWLISQGRRRHLHLWPEAPDVPWRGRRLEGHTAGLVAAGLPRPVMEAVEWQSGLEFFDRMVVTLAGHLVPHVLGAEPIDAVVAMIDSHVPAICAALKRCGREPGRDVTVVGYDANWSEAPVRLRCPLPPAASIDKNTLGIGQAMAHLLEDRIAGRLPPAPQVRMVDTRLVVSQTV